MDRPKLEVADVFRRYGAVYCEQHGASMSIAQRRVMSAIEVCARPRWAATSNAAMSAVTSGIASIAAATATVRSANL